eukprot:scaffold8144_cov21-Tisochrysis_lutea.AAC.1
MEPAQGAACHTSYLLARCVASCAKAAVQELMESGQGAAKAPGGKRLPGGGRTSPAAARGAAMRNMFWVALADCASEVGARMGVFGLYTSGKLHQYGAAPLPLLPVEQQCAGKPERPLQGALMKCGAFAGCHYTGACAGGACAGCTSEVGVQGRSLARCVSELRGLCWAHKGSGSRVVWRGTPVDTAECSAFQAVVSQPLHTGRQQAMEAAPERCTCWWQVRDTSEGLGIKVVAVGGSYAAIQYARTRRIRFALAVFGGMGNGRNEGREGNQWAGGYSEANAAGVPGRALGRAISE